MVGGGAAMSRVLEKFGVTADGPAMNVSAFLDARLGRHPARGDEVRLDGVRVVVRRIRRGRVFEATVTRVEPAGTP
jgi:CBS domain containing-hemolysin-like protein